MKSPMRKVVIIQDLHRLARQLNHTPSKSEIRAAHELGDCVSSSVIVRTFGSLAQAFRAANLPLNRNQEFTKRQLIDQLCDIAKSRGRLLVASDVVEAWRAGTCARPATFKKAFGSIGNAVRAARVGRLTDFTKTELTAQYKALKAELGRLPTSLDIRRGAREYKCAGIGRFQTVGGGLEIIRLGAGLSSRYSRGKLVRQLQELGKKLGKVPAAGDVESARRGGLTAAVGTFQKHFGSFNGALQAAGFRARKPYSRSELIGHLRQLAAELGRRPTIRDLDLSARQKGPGSSPYKARFGTFRAALEAASLEVLPRALRQWNPKPRPRIDLLNGLKRLVTELGRLPTERDVDEAHARGECACHTLFWNEFGGLRGALRAAGFDAPPRRQTRERLIAELRTLTRKLGRMPTARDLHRHKGKYPVVGTFTRYFGSLRNAREAAELGNVLREIGQAAVQPRPRTKYLRAELIRHLRELAAELGRPPTAKDIAKASKTDRRPSYQPYRKEFGGLHAARRAAESKG